MKLRSWASPRWHVLRARQPRVAARIEDLAIAARGRDSLATELRLLRIRLAELERDHLLLAAHVASLTEQQASPVSADASVDADARQRARLAAIAGYEHRLGSLEARLDARRHAGRLIRRMSGGGTSGERTGRAS